MKAPNITRVSWNTIGWNTTSGAVTSSWNTTTKTLTGAETWYAVTQLPKREVEVILIFAGNGLWNTAIFSQFKNGLAEILESVAIAQNSDTIVRWTAIRYDTKATMIAERTSAEIFSSNILSSKNPTGVSCVSCALHEALRVVKLVPKNADIYLITVIYGNANANHSLCSTYSSCDSDGCNINYGIDCYVSAIKNERNSATGKLNGDSIRISSVTKSETLSLLNFGSQRSPTANLGEGNVGQLGVLVNEIVK